jgi:hypothetical protein
MPWEHFYKGTGVRPHTVMSEVPIIIVRSSYDIRLHRWELGNLTTKLIRQPVPTLLTLGPQTNVTDDRDRLYGLLNVMEPEIAALIKPDYKVTADAVLVDL